MHAAEGSAHRCVVLNSPRKARKFFHLHFYQDGLSRHLRALHCRIDAVERRRAIVATIYGRTILVKDWGGGRGGGGGGGAVCHVAECINQTSLNYM